MSDELVSILVLVAVFGVATALGINMGILGIVAAFAVGTARGVSEDDIFAGFPGDLFVILVGVTFLFAIASNVRRGRARGGGDRGADRARLRDPLTASTPC